MEKYLKCKSKWTIDQMPKMHPELYCKVTFRENKLSLFYEDNNGSELWEGSLSKDGVYILHEQDEFGHDLLSSADLRREGRKLTGRYNHPSTGTSGDWTILLPE